MTASNHFVRLDFAYSSLESLNKNAIVYYIMSNPLDYYSEQNIFAPLTQNRPIMVT